MSVQVKPGYKLTEAGAIPKDWYSGTLGQFISLRRGHDLTHRDRRKGTVPVMGSAGQNGFHNVALTAGPGVTLGRSGASFGQAHFCNVDYWPHNTALYVTDFQGNDPLFIFYFLKNIDFSSHNTGGAQQSLNRNFIYPIPVALPNICDQRRISNALSDIDVLISSLNQLITKKRDIKRAVMQQLLTGQQRLPGFSGEWTIKRLGDACKITTGKKDVNEGNPAGQYPFFTCARNHTYSDHYSFDCEAILVAGNGEVGNLSYFSGKFEAYQRTYVLYDFTEITSYIWQQLSAHLTDSLGIGKIGSSIPYIKKGNLTNFEFRCPVEFEEQALIATILSDMDSELTTLKARCDKARELKQGMMQELLSGRIQLSQSSQEANLC